MSFDGAIPTGFKQTEIGQIPEDWKLCRLVDIARLNAPIRYGVVQIGPDTPGGVPIVPIKYICSISTSPLHRAKPSIEERYLGSRIKSGDVLISVKGTIGEVGVVPKGFEGNIAREIARIRPNDGYVPNYVAFQLELGQTQKRIADVTVGSTRLEFSIAAVRQFEIAVPPTLDEQDAIAEVLSDIDRLISELEALVAKKRDLKEAAAQTLLTGETRLPGFSNGWLKYQVRDVITQSFSGPSPTCEERNVQSSDEWGVLKTTAITWEHGWDWTKHKLLPKVFWGKTHIEIKTGDVLVTKAGPRHRVGVTACVTSAARHLVPSGKMVVLRPKNSVVIGSILSAAIGSKFTQEFLDHRTTGMAESQVNFENNDLLEAPIQLPEFEEQTAIATILSDMDTEIEALESQLAKTRDLKTGMMQDLLTGRVRLTASGERRAA